MQEQPEPKIESTVVIHLYDLSGGLARQFSMQFLGKQLEGIWHTGVVVYGYEFYFGGGIIAGQPGVTPYGNPVQRIEMGTTSVAQHTFAEWLKQLHPKYNMTTYNLLTNNCNNFSNEVSMFLTGKPIPEYITGLPQEALSTPMGQMMRPFIENLQNNILSQQGMPPRSGGSPSLGGMGGGLGGLGGMGGMGGGGGIDMSILDQALGVLGGQQGGITPSPTTTTTVSTQPQHHHQQLPLGHLRHSSPVLLAGGADNANKIVAKLKEFIKEENDKGNTAFVITAESTQILERLEVVLKQNKDKLATASLGGGNREASIYKLLDDLLAFLPPEKLFPVLDLLRLVVLIGSANTHYGTTGAPTIKKLMQSHVTERNKEVTPPKGLLLMLFRLAANMFSAVDGAHSMISPSMLQITIDLITESVLSTENPCRLAGATLAHNCSLYIPKNDGDSVTQVISALVHAVGQKPEDRSGEECDYTMLMAIGHLMYTNSAGCELAQILGLDLAPYLASKTAKIAAVAREVASLSP